MNSIARKVAVVATETHEAPSVLRVAIPASAGYRFIAIHKHQMNLRASATGNLYLWRGYSIGALIFARLMTKWMYEKLLAVVR